MTTLRATVRLQLHAGFDFDAAAAQVDYFARLGISHLYLSPIASAVPGSTHGYDNVDPTRISLELGGEQGFLRLSDAARQHGMGILLDIVPNHMAVHPANPWWNDVLRNGRRSAHAGWFDIDWDAPECDGRLWLAVLDRPLAAALADGALHLDIGGEGPCLRHHDLELPLSPLSYPAQADSWPAWIARCRRSPQRMQDVLQRQAYRLGWWRTGADHTNYRRFFDIDGLFALRMELPEVFDAVHALPLRLVAEGHVDGLRVDHVDGLADPQGYLGRLRSGLDQAATASGRPAEAITLHVEKILADDEALPADWACDGTTGYDFMDQVGALLHDSEAGPALHALWHSASGDARSFDQHQQQARLQMLQGSLRCDFDRLLRRLDAQRLANPAAADITGGMLERALRALLQHFPVYRTHGLRSAADQTWLARAADAAAAQLGEGDRAALEQLCVWLHGIPAVLTRFEQLTAPLNAKAVEDTAFYRYGRLLSRNEVGSDPGRLHLPLEEFLLRARQRAQQWPRALLAVATHDHKRGPDARCRLATVSCNLAHWSAQLAHWNELAMQVGRPCPLPGAETLMLWQTLLASWPLQAERVDAGFIGRVDGWLQKALREGKQVSSWSDPDRALEQGASDWLAWLGSSPQAAPLRSALDAFVHAITPHAARLGLVQLALQLCCPGVPDLYQGNEGWDTSLVDPDNRREVDYLQRRAWLGSPPDWRQALQEHWSGGSAKALLLAALLRHRAAVPSLFIDGSLTLLSATAGAWVLSRQLGDDQLLLVLDTTARLETPLAPGTLLRQEDSERGRVGLPVGHWRSLLDARRCEGGDDIEADALLDGAPLAIWVLDNGEDDGR
ncbi:malto-oligosyltrehalose synthase [Stenotrophomonas sp. CFBP 13724]|uniref:malto-oligosyltrehalose synthase n=1 Tax=Stenotrophomonas sp. CFBP 13724 TaxID=2775298 RepID=UPI0017869643|nr:malto-oligosyltrehalose synthase [Stenotrophomonas sp. CFBP 13724]MBD8643246.1 malto-oligosyltrehalose synthase [Stenotrophomonas sp. CFBP 13724]